MTTPLDIDEQIGELFGFRGESVWMVSDDGGKSMCMSTSRHGPWCTRNDLLDWLHERQSQGQLLDHCLERLVSYPRFSSNVSDAFRVVEAARERGWMITVRPDPEGYRVELRRSGRALVCSQHVDCDLLPFGICRVALQIPSGEKIADAADWVALADRPPPEGVLVRCRNERGFEFDGFRKGDTIKTDVPIDFQWIVTHWRAR